MGHLISKDLYHKVNRATGGRFMLKDSPISNPSLEVALLLSDALLMTAEGT